MIAKQILLLPLVFLISTGWDLEGSNVAFFYALDEDVSALAREGAAEVRSYAVGDTTVRELRLDEHRVFAVKMGSGAVRTALSAQALLATQKCDLAISTGPVGDLAGTLEIGKWLLVERTVAWQRGSEDGTGFRLHQNAKKKLEVPFPAKSNPEMVGLLAEFRKLAVASGEVFVASDGFRSELAARTECEAVDMNLFGLLAALEAHGVRGIHFRTASDRADGKASAEFREFAVNYKGEGGLLAARIIRALPEDKSDPAAHPALRSLLTPEVTLPPVGPRPVPSESSEKDGS